MGKGKRSGLEERKGKKRKERTLKKGVRGIYTIKRVFESLTLFVCDEGSGRGKNKAECVQRPGIADQCHGHVWPHCAVSNQNAQPACPSTKQPVGGSSTSRDQWGAENSRLVTS